jgi:hypothetical protein
VKGRILLTGGSPRLSSNDRTLDGEEQSHEKEDAEGEQLPSANDVDVSHIKRTQK